MEAARLGHSDKVDGFRRLDQLTRAVEEEREPLADFSAAMSHERKISPSLGGRTVMNDLIPKKKYKPLQGIFLGEETQNPLDT